MKRCFFSALLAVIFYSFSIADTNYPVMFAHRGGHSSSIPENSIAGVASAKRFGYVGLECDVKYTADSVMVLMHDNTINRTARNKSDYSPIKEKIKVSDLTFDELRSNYVLASPDPELRTPIPTLEEMLVECKKHDMIPMLHSNILESFELAQKILGDKWICFAAQKPNMLKVRDFSNCLILASFRGGKSSDHIALLDSIGGHCGVSTMNYGLLTPDYCRDLKKAGYEVQASIFPVPHEAIALNNGITYQLTDFSLSPDKRFKVVDKWQIINQHIAPGEEIVKRWDNPMQYGGVIVDIEFEGRIEVLINDRQRYVLSDKDDATALVGFRFNDTVPVVKIMALKDSSIIKMDTTVYEF